MSEPTAEGTVQAVGAAGGSNGAGVPGSGGSSGGKRKRSPWSIVFVVSLVVFVLAVTALGVIGFSYLQGQQKYEQLEEYVKGEDPASLVVDWDSLLAKNPDTVAWLYVPNTNINYPVVRGADNDYYLTHDFNGEQGWLANYGAIFMDYRNNPNWTDKAYFIYGHHMNDGSMFASLAGMGDQARFDECRTVYLLSPVGNFKLRTFALIHCAADDPIVQTEFATADEMIAYINDKESRSIVSGGEVPDASKMKKIFAFATCDNVSDGRYVLYAYVESTTAEGLEGVVGTGEGGEATAALSESQEG